VATFLGTLLALYWPMGLACCATWLVMAAATRYSSAAALLSAAMSPLFAVLMGRSEYLVLTTLLALVVWVRHRPNLRRLKDGTETKIGQKT
jgi:glycerol-3-phosphate acyltransferase PlsY